MRQSKERIQAYYDALEKLSSGQYDLELLFEQANELDCLGEAILKLADTLKKNALEEERLNAITTSINAGLTLGEILEKVYADFHELIPYNRIGFSLISSDGGSVQAYWARCDYPKMHLSGGYEAPLKGSSLEMIQKTGQPRILNNLDKYLKEKPDSESTRFIVEEGIRSSLTCPLNANGKPVGFMFFSSLHPGTYEQAHVQTFMRIVNRLSVMVEKGRLVSELAEKKEAIEAQNIELRQLIEMKNRLIGVAAHDLRSPISNIRMAVNLLNTPSLWFEEGERLNFTDSFLNMVERQSDYMLRLLNDLLDVTQIESGKLSLRLEVVDICEFLEGIVALFTQGAQAKGMKVSLQVGSSGKVIADPQRLQQVVDNLLSNAIKFSPPGGTIIVRAEERKTDWRISIQDDGPGIPEEERNLLFEYFRRGSAVPTGGEKSTGLGLAITRRIVEAHGGKIGVEPGPDKGSIFWFTIPC